MRIRLSQRERRLTICLAIVTIVLGAELAILPRLVSRSGHPSDPFKVAQKNYEQIFKARHKLTETANASKKPDHEQRSFMMLESIANILSHERRALVLNRFWPPMAYDELIHGLHQFTQLRHRGLNLEADLASLVNANMTLKKRDDVSRARVHQWLGEVGQYCQDFRQRFSSLLQDYVNVSHDFQSQKVPPFLYSPRYKKPVKFEYTLMRGAVINAVVWMKKSGVPSALCNIDVNFYQGNSAENEVKLTGAYDFNDRQTGYFTQAVRSQLVSLNQTRH